mgnify:CR=1 FL=1
MNILYNVNSLYRYILYSISTFMYLFKLFSVFFCVQGIYIVLAYIIMFD